MEEKIKKRFLEICKIPRVSGMEEKMVEYLESFAKENNLEYIKDANRNIAIYRKGEREGNINLQCHTDMVCEKTKDSMHNFCKDPLQVVEKDGYISANNTTLGADNGAGIAITLEILANKKMHAPDIACIYTAEEETTMQGAKMLDSSFFRGNKVLSLDSMQEDTFVRGSASAKVYLANKKIERIYMQNVAVLEITLQGFLGGHSGEDIAKGRKNAAKVLMDILNKKREEIYVDRVEVGEKPNVIPRSAYARIICKKENRKDIAEYITAEAEKYSSKKERISAIVKKKEVRETFVASVGEIAEYILNLPATAIVTEGEKAKLSANIGKVVLEEDKICIALSTRSNLVEEERKLDRKIRKTLDDFYVEVQEIKGYKKEKNYFLDKCKEVYKKVYAKEAKEEEKHICLESGIFNEKIKDLEYVAISPNISDAHSVNEKVEVASMHRIYNFVVKLLEEM